MASDRCQIPFRLSPDHVRRLDKAARYCGQTRQAFVQTAVLSEIAEVEERRRMKMLRVARGVEDLPSPQEDAEPNSSPLGMGISAATMRKQREDADAPLAQQGQVVVNVGGSGGNAGLTSGGGDLVDQLAAYVVAASDFERQSRLRTAVRILHSTTSSDAERKHLAERLDAAVNAKRPKRDESGGVARAARVAFDKIAGIFTNED